MGRLFFENPSIAVMLILGAIALWTSGCRKDQPPQVSIVCIADGMGGCDGAHPDGTTEYVSPSGMKDYWCTTQTDEANFSAWCYQTSVTKVQRQMARIKARIDGMTRIGMLTEEQAQLLVVERPNDADAVLDGELPGRVPAVTVVQ